MFFDEVWASAKPLARSRGVLAGTRANGACMQPALLWKRVLAAHPFLSVWLVGR